MAERRRNRKYRQTVPASEYVKDESYLDGEERWVRSNLTKPRYYISTTGKVRGPRGLVKLHGSTSIEVRNRNGNPQYISIGRFLTDAFLSFEYDKTKHRFCWLDGDNTNRDIRNLGIQWLTGEKERSPEERASDAPHILVLKIDGTEEIIRKKTHLRTIVLPNLVERERLTDIRLVGHRKDGKTETWTYRCRRKK